MPQQPNPDSERSEECSYLRMSYAKKPWFGKVVLEPIYSFMLRLLPFLCSLKC